jgi:cation:H+ antiporter
VVLLSARAAILVRTVVAARREGASLEEGIRYLPLPRAIMFLAVGLVGMLLGAELITRSGVAIAEILGVPDVIIGLTMVAVGTSLPEFAASVVSMARGHHGIAVGNVIGSNVFNLTFVIGGVALVRPIPVPVKMFSGELPIMIAFSVATFLFMAVGGGIGRWRGLGFLAAYLVFIVWLTLR